MYLECMETFNPRFVYADLCRLDALAPNTPRVGSANRMSSTNKRKVETPSVTRVKAEPASSPLDFKTPYKPGEQNGNAPYVLYLSL